MSSRNVYAMLPLSSTHQILTHAGTNPALNAQWLSLQTRRVTASRLLAASRLQEIANQKLTTTTSSQPLLLIETAAPAHVHHSVHQLLITLHLTRKLPLHQHNASVDIHETCGQSLNSARLHQLMLCDAHVLDASMHAGACCSMYMC